MAKIRLTNLSRASLSACGDCHACWRGKDLLVWYMPSYSIIPPRHNHNTQLGGEFSSLHQNSFHHYRDFWCFDISTHSWDRIDTKIRPSARSGHRYALHILPTRKQLIQDPSMAVWKHFIVLFGGFYDPGITSKSILVSVSPIDRRWWYPARYLNDLWLFDTQEYKWRLVEFGATEPRPS